MTTPDLSGDPAAALAAAAALLDVGPGAARARTVARLLRYALEMALDNYWDAARPGEIPKTVGRGRRLRLLTATLGRPFAHETYTTYNRLSEAARPTAYDPPPMAAELRELQRKTETAVTALRTGVVTSAPATGASCTSRT